MPPEEKGGLQGKTLEPPEPFRSRQPTPHQLVCEGVDRQDLERILKRLSRRSLSDYRERGVRILHAALGMLVWKEIGTNEEIRAPLLVVPIELLRESILEPFAISVPPVEEAVILNPALQVKLKTDFKIELPPLIENGESTSLTDYLNSVSQIVKPLGWRTEATVEIGLFSFHKLVIYKDLDTNSELITQHPIIRAVAGVKDAKLVLDSLPEEKDVDKIENPHESFRVLDADSSQRVSIDYALSGQSFVMQGPPGTGKSQTIANIIAECIARGKSVLFVSDKMAALEVVYKRLNDVGLAPFCLELHSSKANKQEVVAELYRCLNEQLVPRMLPSPHEFEKLKELRNTLNDYVFSLHKKHPLLQTSAHEVLGELSRLEHVPSVPVGLANVGLLTPQRIRELEDLMARLTGVWQVIEEPNFPWRGYKEDSYTLEIRSELSTFLENLISALDLLRLEAAKISKQLGLDLPSTFERVSWLIALGNLLTESPKPEANWVTHPNIDQLIQEAKTHQTTMEWCKITRTRLTEHYNDSLFLLALDKSAEIEQTLSAAGKVINPADLEEGQLLKKRQQFLKLVKDTQLLAKKWNDYSQELSRLFGLPADDLAVEQVRQLSRFALLCFSDNKPELAWFERPYFLKVQEIVPEAKRDFQEYNSLRSRIEKLYSDKIYELDLDEFVRRYNGPYRSFTRWFRPSYHRDQKQIAKLTHEGRVPESVLKDLQDARKVKALRSGIEGYIDSLQRLLGHFYQGYSTDFEAVEKAVQATAEIFKASEAATVPENLVKLVSFGSTPPQTIRWHGIELKETVEEWSQHVGELSSLVPVMRVPNSNVPIYKTPLAALQQWATEAEKQLTLLFEATREVLETRKEEEPQNYKQLIGDLKNAETVRKKENELLAQRSALQTSFGARFSDLETDWQQILSVLEWTKNLQYLYGSNHLPEPLVNVVTRGPKHAPDMSELVKRNDEALKTLDVLESRFEAGLTFQGQNLRGMSIDSVLGRVAALRDRADDLRLWIDFKNIKMRFSTMGLEVFFNRLTEQPPPAAQLLDVFRRGVYQEWINNLYNEDAALGRFRRENHEQVIAEFRKLDQELIRLSASMVIDAANPRKPQDILIQATDSEISVLLKESAKKRRLMPIRSLLQRIPHLLPRLKPCLLMSPISVSQFLSPETMKFDLVLFDEASQIVPEDAIGAIYRGKNIVVAGDNKQLPPTSFFQKLLIEDIDWDEMTEGDVEVFDSILEECLGIGLPVKTLRWHYRSRHEGLIAFSNERFYDGTLITFPSAIAKDDALGVKLGYVKDSVYDRGGLRNNPKEAEVVAGLVFDHFRNHPDKTLGVVTFSIAQMETVEEAIERCLREEPEFERFFKEDRLEGFFVKNLENVQGDERDVMIFSVGYGRDQQGQMTLNFGPLNKAGGERRLNVAITRAREKTVLITSIKASDINVNEATAAGVSALHDYLDYAERSHETATKPEEQGKLESLIEKDVAEEIRRMDYEVIPKVGYSAYPIDMGVVDPANPGCFLLGVECDGMTYRASNSARDRDRLREQVLRQLGWRIHRIWSPDWVARRDSEVRRLKDALEEACELQSKRPASETAVSEARQEPLLPRIEVKQVQFGGAERIGVPYKVHTLKAVFNSYVRIPISKYPYSSVRRNEFHFQENRILQSRLLEELVREEGPIHFNYAVQRLANSWGLRRTGPRVATAVREALNLLIKDHRLVVKGDFLWPNGLVEAAVRVPVPSVPESVRSVEYIPPEEIENAMKLIAQYALSISFESLVVETGRVFGFTQMNEWTKEGFREVCRKLLRERKLVSADDVITIP